MSTLFISDLHLQAERPEIVRAFLQFLAQQTQGIDSLYILGDFFEVWLGDDAVQPAHQPILASLKNLSEQLPIYFMHGNRDFLIGEQFCQLTGCQLLNDPTVVDLYGQQVLLMHGDSLCTKDAEYMAFRQQFRHPEMIKKLLAMSIPERIALGQQLRQQSQTAGQQKSLEIMDVTPEEVLQVMADHQVEIMIHGHTHRPNIHDLTGLNGKPGKRIVLGDWDNNGWVLRWQLDGQYQLDSFPINL
ncbi:UDP-2,3-diacylglucosamine diphosphatase [Endozoicomonas sp. SM1973]|uniref:UDP-2,3-diacylglucosamine hydrolase n=1 Tax=Spartinivicinus marinus TaxID=2994442 RepID=A0A853IAF7_9GAMM|nr:UDP-2,3-diacylglucosamine diphosphatase [Spartinivicinus marinus]MCX4024820.1 UDP-2,3-diacylglucosamine diphosphatase [Spartinivicinus marinus]NYZ66537.1 UDP-2,3-diacylglucosamine diphosphatase [Spartinivicinus marinus]